MSQLSEVFTSPADAQITSGRVLESRKSLRKATSLEASTDNIAALKNLDETQGDEDVRIVQSQSSPRHSTDDDCSTPTSSSTVKGTATTRNDTPDYSQTSAFDAVFSEIQELQKNQSQLKRGFENLKAHQQQAYKGGVEALQEEKYRSQHLEEELSDLTELYQNEILNLKEELASMEDKIAYQSHEQATDIHEALEACQTRLFKLERQQVAQFEGLDYLTPQDKLTDMLLAVMAALLFHSTVASCIFPLMKTRICMLSTLFFALLFFFWSHWDAILDYL